MKTSMYASKNLCYHLDKRHNRKEDGYTKATDTTAWGSKIKEFFQYKRELLTNGVGPYLRPPMYVGFPRILPFNFGRSTIFRLRRVMSAYTDDRQYSVDLVSAVSFSPMSDCWVSITLGIGATTSSFHQQDARSGLEPIGFL